MRYIIFLSGENIPLAHEELLSVIEKQNINYKIITDLSRLIVLDADKPITFSDCAFITEASRFLSNLDLIDSIEFADYKKTPINVRVIKNNLTENIDSLALEKKIGHIFYSNGAKINLNHPEKQIRLYLTDKKSLVGKLVFEQAGNFSKRKASLRPFHMPISLSPKVARAMVNISRSKTGDSVLDPFTGTGGILIEAGLMKCRVFGIDLDPKMIEGTKLNFKEYGISDNHLKTGDAFDTRQIFGEYFDGIVTDFPYGKNTKDGDMKSIAEKFLEYAPSILKKGGYIVAASNFKDLTLPENLKLKNRFEIYIHKSLSKYIYVLQS